METVYQFQFWRVLIFGLLVTAVTAQVCPPVASNTAGRCIVACSNDSDCSDGQLCCSNGCGLVCRSPEVDPCATVRCAAPNCSEYAAGTVTPEGECCPVCACVATNGSLVPPGTSFMDDCNTCLCGSTGVAACTLIGCGQTCPTIQSSNEENCVDECSSDDDCQYDRICCNNGCGGHTCSDSVEMCELIQCDWPVCEDGAEPITSPFSCCPYCPTTGGVTDDNGGTGVIAIASLMAVTMCGLLAIFF